MSTLAAIGGLIFSSSSPFHAMHGQHVELIHLLGISSLSACDSSALSSADILCLYPNQAQQTVRTDLGPNPNC